MQFHRLRPDIAPYIPGSRRLLLSLPLGFGKLYFFLKENTNIFCHKKWDPHTSVPLGHLLSVKASFHTAASPPGSATVFLLSSSYDKRTPGCQQPQKIHPYSAQKSSHNGHQNRTHSCRYLSDSMSRIPWYMRSEILPSDGFLLQKHPYSAKKKAAHRS